MDQNETVGPAMETSRLSRHGRPDIMSHVWTQNPSLKATRFVCHLFASHSMSCMHAYTTLSVSTIDEVGESHEEIGFSF